MEYHVCWKAEEINAMKEAIETLTIALEKLYHDVEIIDAYLGANR